MEKNIHGTPPETSGWNGGGCAPERFFCMTAEPGGSFEEELHSLLDRYRKLGGSGEDEFLLRFHVSDPSRQTEPLRRAVEGRNSYVSVVGQPPANGSRIALEAWHIGGMLEKRKENVDGGTVLAARRGDYRLFLAGRNAAVTAQDSCDMRDRLLRYFALAVGKSSSPEA